MNILGSYFIPTVKYIIICTFVLVGATLILSACPSDWKEAERAAMEYSSNIPNSTGKVSCTHQDTDRDGYCACSIFTQDSEVVPVECGCERICIWCARGCKQATTMKFMDKRKR